MQPNMANNNKMEPTKAIATTSAYERQMFSHMANLKVFYTFKSTPKTYCVAIC